MGQTDIKTPQKRRVGDGTPGPGRPKGMPNKATVAAREAFQMAFEGAGGAEGLTTWAKANQTEFYRLYARLIPVDVQATGDIGLKVEIVRFADSAPTE